MAVDAEFIFIAFEYPAHDRRLRSWAHQLGNDAGVEQPAHKHDRPARIAAPREIESNRAQRRLAKEIDEAPFGLAGKAGVLVHGNHHHGVVTAQRNDLRPFVRGPVISSQDNATATACLQKVPSSPTGQSH